MTNPQRGRVFSFPISLFKNALMVFAIVATFPITNCARAADCTATALTALSTCPKDAQGDVTIGSASCKNAFLDQSLTGAKGFRRIKIEANSALCVRDADFNGQPMSLEAGAITVEGLFEAGRLGAEIGKREVVSVV